MTKKPRGVLFFSLCYLGAGVFYLIFVLSGIFAEVFPKSMSILGGYLPFLYALSGVGVIILAIGMLKAQTWAWVVVMILLVASITFYVLTVNILYVLLGLCALYYFMIPGVRTYFKIPTD